MFLDIFALIVMAILIAIVVIAFDRLLSLTIEKPPSRRLFYLFARARYENA
jgi:hypothetical protein